MCGVAEYGHTKPTNAPMGHRARDMGHCTRKAGRATSGAKRRGRSRVPTGAHGSQKRRISLVYPIRKCLFKGQKCTKTPG